MPETAPPPIVIVNPTAGGGKAQTKWTEIEVVLRSVYGRFDSLMTSQAGDAERFGEDAASDGISEIIVVGGDGTLSEVINGIFNVSISDENRPMVTPIPSGTGGDFRKTLGLAPNISDLAAQLRTGVPRQVDVGRITFARENSTTVTRHFVNIASFGLSGEVDKAVNAAQWPKRLGGRFTYAWCSLSALSKYQPKKVRLLIDDTVDRLVHVNTVAVCNGQYFGGGMHISPASDITDGRFDIVAIEPETTLSGLRNANKLYKGTHLEQPNVFHWRGQKVQAIPADGDQAAWLDIDGEPLGMLPAKFEILPAALTVRY